MLITWVIHCMSSIAIVIRDMYKLFLKEVWILMFMTVIIVHARRHERIITGVPQTIALSVFMPTAWIYYRLGQFFCIIFFILFPKIWGNCMDSGGGSAQTLTNRNIWSSLLISIGMNDLKLRYVGNTAHTSRLFSMSQQYLYTNLYVSTSGFAAWLRLNIVFTHFTTLFLVYIYIYIYIYIWSPHWSSG